MATECDTDVQEMLGDELTVDEETAFIEREAQRELGMSIAEFKARWEAGEYRKNEDPRVTQIAMLLR